MFFLLDYLNTNEIFNLLAPRSRRSKFILTNLIERINHNRTITRIDYTQKETKAISNPDFLDKILYDIGLKDAVCKMINSNQSRAQEVVSFVIETGFIPSSIVLSAGSPKEKIIRTIINKFLSTSLSSDEEYIFISAFYDLNINLLSLSGKWLLPDLAIKCINYFLAIECGLERSIILDEYFQDQNPSEDNKTLADLGITTDMFDMYIYRLSKLAITAILHLEYYHPSEKEPESNPTINLSYIPAPSRIYTEEEQIQKEAFIKALRETYYHIVKLQSFIDNYTHIQALYFSIASGSRSLIGHFLRKTPREQLSPHISKLLYIAIESAPVEALQTLHKYGINFSVQDSTGATPLHHSVQKEELQKTKMILSFCHYFGHFICYADKNGYTPLHVAVERGDIDHFEVLQNTELCVDEGHYIHAINYKTNEGLYTSDIAFTRQSYPIFNRILKWCTSNLENIYYYFNKGTTNIHFYHACNNLFQKIQVKDLSLELRTFFVNMRPNALCVLMLHGTIGNNKCFLNELFTACKKNYQQIESFFTSFSPLHVAVLANNLEMVSFLVKKGANLDKKDIYGNDAYNVAKNRRYTKIATYLEREKVAQSVPNQLFVPSIGVAESAHITSHSLLQPFPPSIPKTARSRTESTEAKHLFTSRHLTSL